MTKQDKTLFEKSGMITHLKTVDRLREKGWSVNISSYYYDNAADLLKEIDIIAEKQFYSSTRHDSSVQLNVQLFMECKYVNQEIIFWFDSINREKAADKLERDTELRIETVQRGGGDIAGSDFHYLKSDRVAKLFSSNANREDVVYKAISQCLRAQVYYQQWAAGPISNSFSDSQRVLTKIIRYPVVVCGNFANMKEVQRDSGADKFSTKNIADSFLLETNYVYFNKAKTNAQDDYFLIDFIAIDSLKSYLMILENEAGAIVKGLAYKRR
jgi:hypothetical protein